MLESSHPAADFVRDRLRTIDGPISQEQMQSLVDDLRAAMGGRLSRGDVIEIVEAFQEEATQPAGQPG